MKLNDPRLFFLIMGLILLLTASAMVLGRNTTLLPTTFVPPPPSSREVEIFNAENAIRVAAKLPPLTLNRSLTLAAQGYAMTMAKGRFFSHTGLDGSTFETRIAAAGYPSNTWRGEIIAAGTFNSVDQLIQGWMNSPGHKDIILGAHYRDVGCGSAIIPGALYREYAVCNFGGPP